MARNKPRGFPTILFPTQGGPLIVGREKKKERKQFSPAEIDEALRRVTVSQTGIETAMEPDSKRMTLAVGESANIQSLNSGKFGFAVRIAQLGPSIAALVANPAFDVTVSMLEGYNTAAWSTPPEQAVNLALPVRAKGGLFFSRAKTIYVTVSNRSGAARQLAASIIPIDSAPLDCIEVSQGAFGFDNIHEFAEAFGVDVDGGVQAGDEIEVYDYNANLLATYPAAEGAVWAVPIRAAFVTYVPIGAPGSLLTWKWYTRK